MGNFKEIPKPGDFDWRAERVGFVNSLQVEPQAIPGRTLGFIKNRQSANNEGNNPENAFWEGTYSVGKDRHGNEALVSSEVGAVRIRGSWFRGSHAMIDSMGRAAALKLVDIQRGIKSAVSLQTLLDQRNQFEAYQQGALALQVGQSMLSFALCGADVSHGVSLQKTTRINNGNFTYQTRLIGGLTDGAAQDLLKRFSNPDNQVIWLDDNKQNNGAYLALVGNINVDLKDEQFIQETINDIFQDRGEQQPKVLKVGPCQNCGVGAASGSGKSSVADKTGILNPDPVFYSAESGGSGGGGGAGGGFTEIARENNDLLEKKVPLLAAPSFFLAAALPTSAVLISQPVDAEFIFTTALRSTVVSNDNSVSFAPFESVSLFPAMRENPKRIAVLENGQAAEKSLPTATAMTEPMFPSQSKPEISQIASNLEENSERLKPAVESVPMIQFINTKPVADKPVNLATVKVRVESDQLAASREVKKREEKWQAKEVVVTKKTVVAQTEQRPVLERAVKELNLPLLEIAPETTPVMALRVELKPVIKADEVEKAIDDEKKVMIEVDQEQEKLFLVENFFVTHSQIVREQNIQPLKIKKMFWRIVREAKLTEASILEFELPKDQNQRLYAFYHFLQKVVKKVVGQDAIRTRQVTVIAEKEDVNFDLELISEIEYYLQLLRRKKNYAQAFAFVN